MKFSVLIFVSIIITGCATIFSGTTDEIFFSTNADPVKVYIDGLNVGNTPLKIPVEKKVGEGRLVRFEKDGYKTQEFNLRNKFDAVALLDISSIVVSGGIDVLTGAMMEYSPKQYHVEMVKDGNVAPGSQSKQIQFASFVLTNADDIKEDLAAGGGEALDGLLLLISPGESSYKFIKWLTDNTDAILSSETPEALLMKIRSSGMTP